MSHFKAPYKAKKLNTWRTYNEPQNIPPRTVEDFLEEAGATLIQRGKEYDSTARERSAARAAKAFNAITGRKLKIAEVWLLLQIVKDVRQFTGHYHQDSAVDCIAYAALKAEALVNQT
mgnify:CR=1 FL=1